MTLPGRPVGPYQGVINMSGENAHDTDQGGKLQDGQLFLEGTAGCAITPNLI